MFIVSTPSPYTKESSYKCGGVPPQERENLELRTVQLCMRSKDYHIWIVFNLEVSRMCVFDWPFYFYVGVFSLVVFYCIT